MLQCLQQNVCMGGGEQKVKLGNWFLPMTTNQAHSALLMHEFLAKNKMTLTSHPPYAPDLLL